MSLLTATDWMDVQGAGKPDTFIRKRLSSTPAKKRCGKSGRRLPGVTAHRHERHWARSHELLIVVANRKAAL
jgi:hypothetical protein